MDLMSTVTELRRTIADFFEVPANEIGPSFSMRSRSDSIVRAALDAAIRHHVGRVSRRVYSATSYGEIETELFPDSSPVDANPQREQGTDPLLAPRANEPYPAVSSPSCGVDIKLIESLPAADDCWETPFYRTHFAPGEIAFCLRQDHPPVHFAARWCIKEALQKCDWSFRGKEMNRIELVAEDSGPPYLVHHVDGTARRLPHAVSLSHSSHTAVAVVMKVEAAVRATEPVSMVPPPVNEIRPGPPERLAGVNLILSLAAIALAVFALLRTFFQVG
jgi:phosphopantetheinyl transferase (holo-ACP synthase)